MIPNPTLLALRIIIRLAWFSRDGAREGVGVWDALVMGCVGCDACSVADH